MSDFQPPNRERPRRRDIRAAQEASESAQPPETQTSQTPSFRPSFEPVQGAGAASETTAQPGSLASEILETTPPTPSGVTADSPAAQAANSSEPLTVEPAEVRPAPRRRREQRARIRRRKTMRKRSVVITLVIVLVLLIGVVLAGLVIKRALDARGEDYSGTGVGEVSVTIPAGVNGSAIGDILKKSGVVASSQAFFTECLNQEQACTAIQPGTYKMKKKMSAASALAVLIDSANRIDNQITVGPGLTKWQVKDQLVSIAGFTAEEVDAAFSAAPGLPDVAGGDVEGWLAPGTYLVGPHQSAADTVAKMIAQSVKRLEASSLPRDQWKPFLIKASIVQREGSDLRKKDYPKIARVVENRMIDNDQTHGFLNMDSTVLYGLGDVSKTRKIPTTTEVADANNPYNTYKHQGLPPGAIGAVGKAAFDGTLNPAEGNWLYFTTVDLNTGETRFSATLEEQTKNVELLRKFCREHDDVCHG